MTPPFPSPMPPRGSRTEQDDALVAELRALGRQLGPTAVEDLAPAVMARVATLPVPKARLTARVSAALTRAAAALRQPRRALAAAVIAVVGVVGLVPPVRAEVASWFGVVVQEAPGPGPSSAPPPSSAAAGPLGVAADRVGFQPLVPASLGRPSGVEVSADGRVLSLTWETASGRLRLDEFRGSLEPVFVKTVYDEAQVLTVADRTALWFSRPHDVQLVDDRGGLHTLPVRVAGPTLVWQTATLTLRLEGARDLEHALAVATSGG